MGKIIKFVVASAACIATAIVLANAAPESIEPIAVSASPAEDVIEIVSVSFPKRDEMLKDEAEAEAKAEAEKRAAEAEAKAKAEAEAAKAEAEKKAADEAARLADIRGPLGEASALTLEMHEITGEERDAAESRIYQMSLLMRDGDLTIRSAFNCDGGEADELQRLFGNESRWERDGSLRLYEGSDGRRMCTFYLRNWQGADVAYIELALNGDSKPEVLGVVRV